MQNKANFEDTQMNVSFFNTKDYENILDWTLGENKPNSNPIKANTKPIKANTKPIKANTNPKQTQTKPVLSEPVLSKAEGVEWANFRLSLCL